MTSADGSLPFLSLLNHIPLMTHYYILVLVRNVTIIHLTGTEEIRADRASENLRNVHVFTD